MRFERSQLGIMSGLFNLHTALTNQGNLIVPMLNICMLGGTSSICSQRELLRYSSTPYISWIKH